MTRIQAIEGEDTGSPFICHIINLLWLMGDKGTHIRFCWIPSHCTVALMEMTEWTSNWLYQGRQRPYRAPMASHHCDQTLIIDHLNMECVCTVTDKSWWILHSWHIGCSLRDNSRGLHSGIPTKSGIFLFDLNVQTFYTIPHLKPPWTDQRFITSLDLSV